MNVFEILLIILLGLLIFLLIEAIFHNRTIKKIPCRIHVNGTRGKSSVARLIAAGLRAGNIRTTTKTTGTLARVIDPDGNETPVYRIGFTNIIEQVKIFRRARKWKSEALVIECMALQPLLQSICELRIVRSTHSVMTNARPDHLDVMGPRDIDVALALAATTPVKGRMYTAEDIYLHIFELSCRDRKSELIAIGEKDSHGISDEEIDQFSYSEFKINVALALKVCMDFGVDREVALQGMYEAKPDPGAMTIHHFEHSDQALQFTFANAFAANDPVSTGTLWHTLCKKYPADHTVLLINCRDDRPERSAQLAEALLQWDKPSMVCLIGSGTDIFMKEMPSGSAKKFTILALEALESEEILNALQTQLKKGSVLLVGVGNIAGIGLRFIDAVQLLEEKKRVS